MAGSAPPLPGERTLASPLTLLLEEEQHGDRQAAEVLFLSFTTDLGFFEAVGLGVAQACGARVTVVGDAAMSLADPRAVRRAGRSYLPGHAVCGGAFHPKLMVVVGPDRATVAVGSGNLTLAGWQSNAELWTVLRAQREAVAPAALIDLAAWLRDLPDKIRFSTGVPEAFDRIAAALQTICDQTEQSEDGTVLVSSSTTPILDQLPAGPVEELAVCAPFHDRGAVALRRLVTRMQPTRLTLSYQPDFTQLDGPALADLAVEVDAEIRIDGEHRYRHGKLIEWVAAGRRYALTGSPNLSGAALLTSLDHGGNCELGLIAPVHRSLMPDGASVPTATVRAIRYPARGRDETSALLLGVSRMAQGLHLMLGRAMPASGHVELSPATAPPEVWEPVGAVAEGTTEMMVTVAADAGSRVRLVMVADGVPRYSNVVFVVDPVRVLRRPGITAAHVPTTRPDDLFDDPRLAERFLADLTALATRLTRPPSVTGAAATSESPRATTNIDEGGRWEQYLDDCAGRVGHPLLRFALGLPAVPYDSQPVDDALLPVSWDERVTDDLAAGLDDDSVETTANAGPQASDRLPDLRHESFAVRHRYRQWARRLTRAAPDLEVPERMLVTRLLLWTAAAGAWNNDDHTWLDLLADTVVTLGVADVVTQAEPQVASLVAVALAVLRAHAPRHVRTQETLAFTRAARAVDYLLPAADAAYIDEYSLLLDAAFGPAVWPDHVQTLAAEVVQADPFADAERTLTELGRDIHRHDKHLLHVTGAFTNPLPVALQAVGAAQDAPIVGAWATSTNGDWVLVIWRKPDLITIDGRGPAVLWRHYQLQGLITPASIAVQRHLEGAKRVHHGPFRNPFPEALALLGQLGLADVRLPPECSDW